MKTKYLILVFASFISCEKNTDKSLSVTFNFYSDTQGWSGDFADYPAGQEEFYELNAGWERLPAPLDTLKGAFRISGNNHSDDLFMFIRYKVSDLLPATDYRIILEAEFASDAPTNAVGIGGAPGEGVTLKVGAVPYQPDKILGDNDYYIMNIDKGNQSSSGEDMITVGHIGVSDTTTIYTLISRGNETAPLDVTTNENGECWVIVGTDSGFEGTTTLYFNEIKLVIMRK
jgi:hypothetical protein